MVNVSLPGNFEPHMPGIVTWFTENPPHQRRPVRPASTSFPGPSWPWPGATRTGDGNRTRIVSLGIAHTFGASRSGQLTALPRLALTGLLMPGMWPGCGPRQRSVGPRGSGRAGRGVRPADVGRPSAAESASSRRRRPASRYRSGDVLSEPSLPHPTRTISISPSASTSSTSNRRAPRV
jgi:hypothetical protein